MPITADALRQEIANLEQQRQRAADTVQQAIGAINMARAILAQLEQEQPATAEPVKIDDL